MRATFSKPTRNDFSEYAAPDGAWNLFAFGFYKDAAPTALGFMRWKTPF
jgi:hypothetical protein